MAHEWPYCQAGLRHLRERAGLDIKKDILPCLPRGTKGCGHRASKLKAIEDGERGILQRRFMLPWIKRLELSKEEEHKILRALGFRRSRPPMTHKAVHLLTNQFDRVTGRRESMIETLRAQVVALTGECAALRHRLNLKPWEILNDEAEIQFESPRLKSEKPQEQSPYW